MQSVNPFDVATCMYYTGIDPFTKEAVYVARGLRDRKAQRALMQFFKPDNWFTVREALIEAGRADLTGNDCDCLVPVHPPKGSHRGAAVAGERPGPLPHRLQPGEGRAGRRAPPAGSGLQAGAKERASSGQEAEAQRRLGISAAVAGTYLLTGDGTVLAIGIAETSRNPSSAGAKGN
jgi:uncharacterized protein DUF3362